MTAPSFTYSGNVYTAAAAGSVDFALISTSGNPIAYLQRAHIHVYKSANQGSTWTELSRPSQWDFVSGGTVARLVTGIASGDWIKVQRITPTGSAYVIFQSSSLLTAEQLNDDTLFNTYLNQEVSDQAGQTAVTADSAVTAANGVVATANTALSNSSAAQTTAASAVSTANAANASSTSAVSTADAANATANAASTSAANAVSTANAANATAASAVSTANAATASAAGAVTTANAAEVKADAAIAVVSSSLNYTPIVNVAAIPASPANNTYIEVQDTTGLESFSPLAGRPAGFVGDSGLKARIWYSTAGTTWNWIDYSPADSDGRYLKKAGGTMTGAITLAADPSQPLQPATKQYVDSADAALQASIASVGTTATNANTTANAALPKAGGTMTGAITFAGGQTFPGASIATYQEFTSNGTWTKPANCTSVYVEVVGGGAGGGSGCRQSFGSNRYGGGGGAGGTGLSRWFRASDLTNTVSITVGAGGNGGAGRIADSTTGLDGGTGGETSFGPYITSGIASGGWAGNTTGTAIAYPGFRSYNAGGLNSGQGKGSTVTGPGTTGESCFFHVGGAGGGGGGGQQAGSSVTRAGGSGGINKFISASNTLPGPGASATAGESGGGGGGTYVTLTTGMSGGNGGFPGGAGGGGAASDNGYTSGAGGNGAAGVVRVWSW